MGHTSQTAAAAAAAAAVLVTKALGQDRKEHRSIGLKLGPQKLDVLHGSSRKQESFLFFKKKEKKRGGGLGLSRWNMLSLGR